MRNVQRGGNVSARHQRFREHKPLLEYVKFMLDECVTAERVYGDSLNRAIIILIMIGWMEHQPCSLSALAAGAGATRPTAMRRVEDLVCQGLAATRRERNRVVVLPSERLLDWMADIGAARAIHRVERMRRIVAAFAATPMRWPHSSPDHQVLRKTICKGREPRRARKPPCVGA